MNIVLADRQEATRDLKQLLKSKKKFKSAQFTHALGSKEHTENVPYIYYFILSTCPKVNCTAISQQYYSAT